MALPGQAGRNYRSMMSGAKKGAFARSPSAAKSGVFAQSPSAAKKGIFAFSPGAMGGSSLLQLQLQLLHHHLDKQKMQV